MSGTINGAVPSVFLQPDIKHVVYRMVEIVAIFALGFYCLSRGQFLLFAILAGIGEGRCGWFMHEGGHYSLTGGGKWMLDIKPYF